MSTTELHVEQVLIGAPVLAAALLPWLPELSKWAAGHAQAIDLAAGAIAIGPPTCSACDSTDSRTR